MASQIKQPEGSFFKEPRQFPKRFVNGFPIGKRTKARQAANRDMNKLGIKHCEIQLPGICEGRIYLGWAHPTKSRFILNDKDWRTAAKCCGACHSVIEAWSHEKMAKVVRDAIARRKPVEAPSVEPEG